MCDENLNLNKNLLGRWIYRKYVHIKVGSSQMCTITYKGKGGGSNFVDFFAYVLCV